MDFEFFSYVYRYNKNKRRVIVDNLEGIDKNKILVFKNRNKLNKWLKQQK